MNVSNRALVGVLLGLLLVAGLQTSAVSGKDVKPAKDFTSTDLEQLGIKLVTPKKDPKTGFLVGGKNTTDLIKGLTEINGRTIAELEKDMRPGAKTEVGSTAGFLGKDERLLDVLVEDNRYVVEELGLTHQELAKHLHALGEIASRSSNQEILYHGKRFKVSAIFYKGFQLSPFHDGTKTSRDVTIENLDNGKKITYSLLVPYMIERYGFYEGKGTRYRVDPKHVLEVFDFMKGKGKP